MEERFTQWERKPLPKKKYPPYSWKPREEYFADQYAEQLYKHFKLEEQREALLNEGSLVRTWSAAIEVTRPDQEERL